MQRAADAIADHYGLGGGPWTMTPVARGALGQIWKLSGGGTTWAVKELLFGCDEEQVRREAALRDAAEELGISAPRLMPNRDGSHVTRLDGSCVKLYDWVGGGEADRTDPEMLSWCGRTLALLHRAGEGATETPNAWYEECPQEADWARLLKEVRQAGAEWAEELGRFLDTRMPELARHVTPSGLDGLVTSHLDMQPPNVLVGPDGPTLIDWDNAGVISAERELARVLYVWAGGNDFSAEAARRLTRAYADAGGPARITGLDSFSMLFATDLNFVYVQAECAIDPKVTPEQREFASRRVIDTLATLPDPPTVARLAATTTT
ncbi:phosphotransferase enzyme family protein [Streptomyces justiciae]|uniref:phosphotransferase enzyme family protein n=1 Tax=Streptomyces justiciae TaxID=2780140 RepID=UPI00211826C6|nr:aminoglycoside phosphotransferase family protein [Streptomyces justiciae]MCW8381784.1 aminoglycoside phosphotransferase family protein [Streptomyces justiciae]